MASLSRMQLPSEEYTLLPHAQCSIVVGNSRTKDRVYET